MKRRKFLLGTGAAAVGGSALLGSGAFSRVESHRSVTVAVAEDPNAYLGLSKCRLPVFGERPNTSPEDEEELSYDPEFEETPNSSFVVETNDNGHIEIDMGHSGEGGGEGVNSNSVTSFDNVFQITNQGKEPVCVDLRYDPEPVPDQQKAEDAGLAMPEHSVVFYKGGARESSSSVIPNDDGGNIFSPDEIDINGPNAHPLGVGESICIGIQTRTFGIDAIDGPENLLNEVDHESELKIVADVGGRCDPATSEETCEIFGIDRTTDDQFIRSIRVGDGGVTEILEIASLTDDVRVPGDENKPNGLAYDPADDHLYFSSPVDEPGDLFTVELGDLNGDSIVGYDDFEDRTDGEISGAAFAYNGGYYYVIDGDDELKKATIAEVGDPDSDVTVESTGIRLPQSVSLGDVAVNRDENTVYVSSWDPSGFFKIDLDAESAEDLTGDVDLEFENKQIAYGVDQFGNPQLYGTDAQSGDWFALYPDTGGVEQIVEDGDELFTDLAACGAVFGDDTD